MKIIIFFLLFFLFRDVMFLSSIGREIEISDIERMKFKKVNALHCTVAILSVLPKRIAEELGIEAERE